MKYFIFALFLFAIPLAYGQNDDININYHRVPNTMADSNRIKKIKNTDYLEQISIGGVLGAQIGAYTYVELSPDIAYHFNEWSCVGIGGAYILLHNNFLKITSHVAGVRVFAEGHFLRYLGVHAAYQALNYESFSNTTSIKINRIWSNNLSIGGGYYQRANRVAIYAYVLYNISNRPPEENIYGNVLFKAGFSIFLK